MNKQYCFLFIVVSVCVLLVACTNEEPVHLNESDSTQANEILENQVDIPKTALYLIRNFESRDTATIIDLLSYKDPKTFTLEEGNIIRDQFNFESDYFAMLIGGGDIDMDGFSINSHEDERLRYLILDETLTVHDELFITNEYLNDSFYHMGTHVIFENNQLVVYYAVDSMVASWNNENQTIRRYNVHTGETEVLFEIDDDELFVNEVRKVTDEKFFFLANRLNDEENLHYGFIDLQTGEMTVFNEAFNVNHRGISNAGTHLLLSEAFSEPQSGQWDATLSVDRGQVIVISIETGDTHYIPLPGLESYWAILSLNGNYIVTVGDTGSYLRKYDVESGNLITEQATNLDNEFNGEIIPITNEIYVLLSFDENGTHLAEVVMLQGREGND